MKLEQSIIEALRADGPLTFLALRAATGAAPTALRETVQRMRYQGKIPFDRLELAPSLREEGPHPAGHGPAVPLPEAGEGRDAATETPDLKPDGPRQTTAMELASVPAPGGGAAQPPSSGPFPADGDNKRALPPRPSGAELAAEIRAYCRAQAIGTNDFSIAAVGYSSLMGNVLRSLRPLPRIVAMVRDFIAAHPDGLPVKPEPVQRIRSEVVRAPLQPAPRPTIADVVRAEAEGAAERRTRAIAGGSGTPLSPLSRPAVEAIQAEAVATPGDLMLAINRRHPQLMRRAVQLSRARGVTPAAALYDALERGLSTIETGSERGLSHVEQERAHG